MFIITFKHTHTSLSLQHTTTSIQSYSLFSKHNTSSHSYNKIAEMVHENTSLEHPISKTKDAHHSSCQDKEKRKKEEEDRCSILAR